MALRADLRNLIAFRYPDEPLGLIHPSLHILCTPITAVTVCASNTLLMVNIMLEQS